MPFPSSDQNLLFGILALQMDFISRDALIKAMHAWVLEKTKPLGAILLEHKALSPDTYELLDALVAKHLALHDNEPEKSLASVSSIGSLREDLKKLADPEIDASLVQVSAARQDDDPYATRPYTAGEKTSDGLRFRILRPHDKGGLGEVFVAEDQELHREVALKEIQEQYADDPQARARFLMEAEITGGLEHPGIVPVYGLGQYADGRPFYAMRFIKGDNLKNAIERFHKAEGPDRDPGERTLEFRKLLRRFQDVCNAVAYAHSRGVLHRDLKPGNIMLGQYGETLVVDWGLAKTKEDHDTEKTRLERPIRPQTGSGSEPTKMGLAIGTPSYMSPEQALGRWDVVGPQSDVYSLGATLYTLLTGSPPFQNQEFPQVFQAVKAGDFAKPRQIKSSIPPTLEAICLKAMSLQAEDRYTTPRELTEDIEHWLADEPVGAYREPWSLQTRRWLKRHRTLVSSAGVGLIVAVSCLAVSVALLATANGALEQANLREKKSAQEAVTERDRARSHFLLARDTVKKYCVLVTEDAQLKHDDFRQLRVKLLQSAGNFYETFSNPSNDEVSQIGSDRATAYRELGFITREIGSPAEAIRYYELANLELEKSHRGALSPVEAEDKASCFLALGDLYHATSRNTEAEDAYHKALRIISDFSDDQSSLSLLQPLVARVLISLGSFYQETGSPSKAEESYLRSLDTLKGLRTAFPSLWRLDASMASTYGNLGRLYTSLKQQAKADESFDKASKLEDGLVRDHPEDPSYPFNQDYTYHSWATLCTEVGNLTKAEEMYGKALAVRRRLEATHPSVNNYKYATADLLGDIALFHTRRGLTAQADVEYEEAIATLRQLTKAYPTIVRYQRSLSRIYQNRGVFYYERGNLAKAEAALLIAMEHARILLTSNPDVPDFIQMVSGLHLNLGNIYRDWGKSDKAESEYRDAFALQRNLVKEHAKEPEYQRLLALILHNLGKLYQDMDRPKDARKPYEEALQIRERLAEASVQDLQLKVDVGRTCNNLANASKRTGDLKKAEDLLKRAIRIRKELVDKEATNAEYQTDLASSHHNLGNLYGGMGKNSESEKELKAAMAIQLRLYHDQPNYINNVINFNKCCTSLSFLLIIMKRYDESVEAADQAIRVYEELLTKQSELLEVKLGLAGSYDNKATALGKLGKKMDAIKAWNSAIAYDNGKNRTYLQVERSKAYRDAMDFMIGLVKMGQYAAGVEQAKKVAEWEPKLRPDAALALAIASEAVAKDIRHDKAEQERLRDQYREEAMALLIASNQAGLLKDAKNLKLLTNDPSFECLRNRDDFKKLIADQEGKK